MTLRNLTLFVTLLVLPGIALCQRGDAQTFAYRAVEWRTNPRPVGAWARLTRRARAGLAAPPRPAACGERWTQTHRRRLHVINRRMIDP